MNIGHRFFGSGIAIADRISYSFAVFVYQNKVNAPCVDSDTYRNFADLRAFFKAALYFAEKPVNLPAQIFPGSDCTVGETVQFFYNGFAAFVSAEDMPSA